METYIHPSSPEIKAFIEQIRGASRTAEEFINNLFHWFDKEISYSRINMPFFPLQRSDLDLLNMKCGTCGDYSNLVVSLLITMGIPARYAYISKDCYGDEQDHICAAALIDGNWILIDPTLPYRKWHGYNCPHQEYELLEPEAFEKRLKAIEDECIAKANRWGIPDYAGLLYAPWIHDDIILSADDRHDSVFYLLFLNEPDDWSLYVTYMSYTKDKGHTPIMATITSTEEYYQFSVKEPSSIWDNDQWSNAFSLKDIPVQFQAPELQQLRDNMDKNVSRILSAAKLKV